VFLELHFASSSCASSRNASKSFRHFVALTGQDSFFSQAHLSQCLYLSQVFHTSHKMRKFTYAYSYKAQVVYPWNDYHTLVPLSLGAIIMTVFLFYECRIVENPLIRFNAFKTDHVLSHSSARHYMALLCGAFSTICRYITR
jgi:hypothetical protein